MKMSTCHPTKWVSLFLLAAAVPAVQGGEPGKTILALGDSIAAGQLPFLTAFFSDGFPGALFDTISVDYGFDTVVNAGCPAETTGNFLVAADEALNYTTCFEDGRINPPSLCYSGLCDSSILPKGLEGDSQMDAAETYIMDHPEEVGLITIALGANDLNNCNTTNALTCFPAAFQGVSENLAEILTRLQTAAPGVPIIGLRYHDPTAAYYLPGGDANVADASALIFASAADALGAIFAQFGAHVADGFGAINGYNTSGDPRADAVNVCMYTGMCTEVDGEYQLADPNDRHPNEAGYDVLGQAFVDVIEAEFLFSSAPPSVTPGEDTTGSESAAPTAAATTATSPTVSPVSAETDDTPVEADAATSFHASTSVMMVAAGSAVVANMFFF